MGLDISAFKEVDFNSFQPREGKSGEELDELYDNMLYLYSEYNPHNQSDNIKKGFYNRPDRAFNFRAGSYSGYNLFRATLCKSVYGFSPEVIWGSPNKYKGQDFVELINFSDCEGIIGPKTSKKLLDDFIKNEENFINYLEKEPFDDYVKESYKAKYKDWMKAFEIASENGVVKFC